jgi:hypothetical protein
MNCIITQSKDQSKRLKDWILYHYEEGFDTFIYFDDYSEDNSVEILKEISLTYGIRIIIGYSDGFGNRKSITEMQSSESYGGDVSINYRIIRSYNRGLDIARNIDPNAICAIIDVDEFIVSSKNRVADSISYLLEGQESKHLYLHSFDVSDDFAVEEWYTTNPNTSFRWDYESRKDSIYRGRGKSVCAVSEIQSIPQGPNYVHILKDSDQIKYVDDYDFLRIHHFRKPNMDKNIKMSEDKTLFNKMILVKEKYQK